MSEIRLSGLLKDRYKTKFLGFVNKYCHPVLGYSSTPCSYPNNLSSHPVRDCSMHSPLRVKIQNALNKALQLEHTDVLFVGGRRRNRKRRKHAKDKRKSKKYEGKETPVLKPKTYNGSKGNYVALVADDISLSPSMVDELFDDSVVDYNDEVDDDNDEIVHFDKEVTEKLPELCDTDSCLMEEMCINTASHERPCSCDTGYNSEEDRKVSTESEHEETEDETTVDDIKQNSDIVSEANEQNNFDDVFTESGEELDTSLLHNEKEAHEYSLMDEITKAEAYLESIITEDEEENERTDVCHEMLKSKESAMNSTGIVNCGSGGEIDEHLKQVAEDMKNAINEETDAGVRPLDEEKPAVQKEIPEPRVIANFDYDDEDEVEIYTKQPRSWFRRKPRKEDEELRPLICCGDDNGVGLACCTIL